MFGIFKSKAKKAKALEVKPKKVKVSNMDDNVEPTGENIVPESYGDRSRKEINHHLYTHKRCFDKAEDDFCDMMSKIKRKFKCEDEDDECGGSRRRRRRRGGDKAKHVFHLHWGAEIKVVKEKDHDCDCD